MTSPFADERLPGTGWLPGAIRPGETRVYFADEIRMCGICGHYMTPDTPPHHSHECRDCGADIDCHAREDSYGVCIEWEGGRDRCPNGHER